MKLLGRIFKTSFSFFKNSAKYAANNGDVLAYAKSTIKSFLMFKLKTILGFIIIGLLILSLVISAAGAVFEIFASIKNIFTYDIDMDELANWAEGLSEEEISELLEYGINIHPKKIPLYVEGENNSYSPNVVIKTPIIKNGVTTYIDYELKRGDTAYPYRLWWQMLANLDILNDTSDKLRNIKIVENAIEDLSPIYIWHDANTPDYREGDTYEIGSGLEEIIKTTIKTETTTREVGGGSGSTSEEIEETIEYYPLPYLSEVETMFATYKFSYEQTTNTETTTNTSTSYSTVTEYIEDPETGEVIEIEHTYETIVTTTITVETSTYVLDNIDKSFNDRLKDFADENNIEKNTDIEFGYYIVEQIPNNQDLLTEYEDYLSYLGYFDYYSEFDGEFGEYVGGGILTWPVPNHTYISSYYGYRIHPIYKTRKFHTGIDIPAPRGTIIVAAEDGIVSFTGRKGTYGLTVIINHGSNIETLYAHNSSILVRAGESVKRGQPIAKIGSTGASTGPHLHFEVRKNGRHTNPLPWLTNNTGGD